MLKTQKLTLTIVPTVTTTIANKNVKNDNADDAMNNADDYDIN